MQRPLLSLHSVLEALDLDTACISLLEQTPEYGEFIHADTPETIYAAIRTIGNILNTQQRADQLVDELEERINIIAHKLKFIAEENKPKVVIFDDRSSLSTVRNSYLANLIKIAGGIHLMDTENPDPDVTIFITEKPMPQLLNELPHFLSTWSQTNAVLNNRVYIVHNGSYLCQPGSLVADDAEILAEILYPKYFIFGRDADVWMKFEWE